MSFFKANDRRYFFYLQDSVRRGVSLQRHEYGVMMLLCGESLTGWGRDSSGRMFAVIEGHLTSSLDRFAKVSFTFRYKSSSEYPVRFSGTIDSSTSNLIAHGYWYRKTGFWYWQYEHGTWNMALHALPVKIKPEIVLAMSWDLEGALCRCISSDKESVYEEVACGTNVDPEWDFFLILTGHSDEVTNEIMRGKQILLKNCEAQNSFGTSVIKASSYASSANPNPYGWLKSVESAAVSLMSLGSAMGLRSQYSWAPSFALLPVVAALSSDSISPPNTPQVASSTPAATSSQFSHSHIIKGCCEVNHVPQAWAVYGTQYERHPNLLPSLCTEYVLCKRNPSSISAASEPTPSSCDQGWAIIIQDCLKVGDIVTALKLQILIQYGYWDVIGDYADGLEGVFSHLTKLKTGNGQVFLSGYQVRLLSKWLTKEVNESNRAREVRKPLDYVEKVNWQLLRLLEHVEKQKTVMALQNTT